jgi:hypothetical protein
MALRNGNDKSNASPAFEAEEPGLATATVTDLPAADTAAAADAGSAAADTPSTPAASTEVVKAAGTAISAAKMVSKNAMYALAHLQDSLDKESLDWNTFPKVVAGLDGFSLTEGNVDLGKVIKVDLLSWSFTWTASPGVDDDDAKALVRYSDDGETISRGDEAGQSIHDYVKRLKEVEGYDKAAVKQYINLYGFMTFARGEDVPDIDRTIVAVQVPPQSKALFDRYNIESGVKIKAGIMQPTNVITMTQEKVVNGQKKYAIVKFSRG